MTSVETQALLAGQLLPGYRKQTYRLYREFLGWSLKRPDDWKEYLQADCGEYQSYWRDCRSVEYKSGDKTVMFTLPNRCYAWVYINGKHTLSLRVIWTGLSPAVRAIQRRCAQKTQFAHFQALRETAQSVRAAQTIV